MQKWMWKTEKNLVFHMHNIDTVSVFFISETETTWTVRWLESKLYSWTKLQQLADVQHGLLSKKNKPDQR